MKKLTRRDFLKNSSAAAGAFGMGSTASLWAESKVQEPLAGITFYVAAGGNDAWSGKVADPNAARTDGPFATLYKARNAVRELRGKKTPAEAVNVIVRGGKYHLDQTLVFGDEDSGSSAFPVTYKAYSGEKVVVSGGRNVTGWKPYKGEILQAALPNAKGGEWKFRQLFLNGEPQMRSRYPKYDASNPLYGGWLFAEGPTEKGSSTSFIFKPGAFPRRWAKPQIGEVVMFPGGGWVDATLPIKTLDEKARIITAVHGYRNPDIAPWYAPDSFRPGDRFRVENLLEELTTPGEWCLDPEEGILYFWPPAGSLKPTDEVVAPVVSTLIDIDSASWLVISGFTFTETLGGDDLHRFGLDGYGAMYPNQGWEYCGEALHLKDAEHCVIEENHFYAVGGNAIYLERYNARNIIRRNEIGYVGANGVCLLGNHIPVGSVSEPMRKGREPLPMFNEVTDNFIHHCGVLNKYIAGVFLGVSDSNLIAHNRFENLPHHAINLGLNGYGRNVLEYNDISHVCLELRDNGAINCWMDDPESDERAGHIIRFNRMTDLIGCQTNDKGQIIAPDGMANGIYLDNNSSNCLIHGNIIVRCSGYAFLVHGGQHNLIENNIIIDAATTSSLPSVFGCGQVSFAGYAQSAFLVANQFCNNIVYFQKSVADAPMAIISLNPWDDGNRSSSDATNAISESQRNVYFRRDEGEYIIIIAQHRNHVATRQVLSLAEWRALGFDTDSEIVDPMFVDPAHDDYRLKPESAAIRAGFIPIDMTQIGIRQRG